MKLLFLAGCTLYIFLANFPEGRPDAVPVDKEAYNKARLKLRSAAIGCSPDWTTYYLSKEEISGMIPLPGTGSHTWKISTTNDSAQFYFNQGINLYYGFHIIEAMPSFKKAQTFDTACAMLYWAEALAYGPNINDFIYTASASALTAITKAKALMYTASSKEGALVEAMESHYSNDTTVKREFLNQQYAGKMKALYVKYSTDQEIGALYADALMNLHPWDLWNHDGKPKPWTPEIETVLENVLKYSPEHPGANHYYIHTMEASPFANKAAASADRLAKLAPGMAHVVHMPSHIYIRTGQYSKGINTNIEAVKSYQVYKQLYPEVEGNAPLYEFHNRHMQAACSINKNDYDGALKDATGCRNIIDTSMLSFEAPMGSYVQYVYMTPELAMVTFKKWDEIIAQPDVPAQYHFAALIQQFAKGLAYANNNNLQKANASLKTMESLLEEKDLAVVLVPFNAPLTSGNIAKNILMGTIAEKQHDIAAAIKFYKTAVATEDSLVYNEPRDWLVPARHYLGNILLNSKKYNDAAKVFSEDLVIQPQNFISSQGVKAATGYKKSAYRK
ncbi:MAG: hypothetical protein ABIN97_19455 [Ginsengibacter sp.]